MSVMVTGQRIGAFVLFRDEDGIRHLVKLGAVLAMSDAGDDQCATIVQLTGNKTVTILSSLDEVLTWLT